MDESVGEFWLENPWQADEHNLSSFERNRILLNVGDGRFLDVSHATTADIDSDSRGVAVGDFNGDGMPDLMVRSSGGGPLRAFENRWPKTHWLKVSLRGVQSNRLGIGAKLKLESAGRTLWRELYPIASFLSQLPSLVHFGLGDSERVDRLTVFWPSGETQSFEDLAVDRHLQFTEGATDVHEIKPPQTGRAGEALHDE